MTLLVSCCMACGQSLFPVRFLCPTCGNGSWRTVPCESGRVAESTVVRMRVGEQAEGDIAGNVHLASIETDRGPIVIAAIDPSEWPEGVALIGAAVRVAIDDAQRIHAHPAP